MTDKELLMMAAEAAFIPVIKKEIITSRIAAFKEIKHTKRSVLWLDGREWNPLTSDGDALRLAVKLRMQVSVTTESCRAETLPVLGVRVNDKDEFAATRRAIVMAAANAWNDKL